MASPQGTVTRLALHDEYVRKVNTALEHGLDAEAAELAAEYAAELGLVRAS